MTTSRAFAAELVSEFLRTTYYDQSFIWDQYPKDDDPERSGSYYIDDDERFALRCMTIAANDIDAFERLYRRTRYSDIAWLHHLQAANNWRPPTDGDGT